MTLLVAVNYGGRDEILDAVRAVAAEAAARTAAGLPEVEITEADIERHLHTAGIPDPDLVIRTSGEMRISNFLLWQIAYSEFVVSDFDRYEFLRAVLEFQGRNRRFGAVE